MPTAAGSGSATCVVKNKNPRVVRRVLEVGTGQHGGQRKAGTECLGQGQDVRDDAVTLEGIPGTGAAEPGLGLVEDQQHSAFAALVPQRREVAGRRLDDTAGAEDRLDDAGGQAADRLRVDQAETEVQLALPIELAVGGGEVRAVAVGRGDGKVARRGRAIAFPARAIGGARSCLGHAVPGPGERDDLVFAGDELGHPDGRLVRLGAGRQQQRLLQGFWQCLGQPACQVDDGAAEHAAEEVVELRRLPRDGGDDLRMRVAEDRAHLARGEVENLAAVLGEQEAPGRMVNDLAGERASAGIADQMPVGVGPEGIGGRKLPEDRSGHGSDGTSGPGDPSISRFQRPCLRPDRTARSG